METVNTSTILGTIVGHCPKCFVPVVEKEINHKCSKCGNIIRDDCRKVERQKPVLTQTQHERTDAIFKHHLSGYKHDLRLKHEKEKQC